MLSFMSCEVLQVDLGGIQIWDENDGLLEIISSDLLNQKIQFGSVAQTENSDKSDLTSGKLDSFGPYQFLVHTRQACLALTNTRWTNSISILGVNFRSVI